MKRHGSFLGVALVVAATVSGCGSGTETWRAELSPVPSSPPVVSPGPPQALEGLETAELRIEGASVARSCRNARDIFLLNLDPVLGGVPCDSLRSVVGMKPARAEFYGSGAVLDYQDQNGRWLGAVLIVDADGRYHLAFVNQNQAGPSVGTQPRSSPNDANGAVQALRDGDCAALKRVTSSELGVGHFGSLICDYAARSGISGVLAAYPTARPRFSGGNSEYSFYRLSTPTATYTLVFARDRFIAAYQVAAPEIGPPSPRESPDQAVRRIHAAIESGDCRQVNRLPMLTRPYDLCAGLRTFANEPVSASAIYGDSGGVVALGEGLRRRNLIVLLDGDGRYHLALVDPVNIEQNVGTRFDPRFDRAASDAFQALQSNDCDALRRIALVRYGPGSAPKTICRYATQTPLALLLHSQPQAELRRMGGNSDYAFYEISTRQANYTMVMARESETGVVPGSPPLPVGAPEYGFVDAYRTNPPGSSPSAAEAQTFK